ncbi:UDP-N-acetylmuramoyl-tripeptide--D-alanyl-D-alanine ligase [Bacillus taeanensis]|nr:UDP-N-acetylmuramoyl-tripeptide--D-alanyl-D-alanine ligase [Bacillus taeanensis]
MKNIHIKTIIEKINGKIQPQLSDFIIENVTPYWRNIRQNTLFFDCFKYPIDWSIMGRTCVIVTEEERIVEKALSKGIPVIKVDNIRTAYWEFVQYYRQLFTIPVIGVTGTCGKTTTKDMITHILAKQYKVLSTYKSNNADEMNLPYLLGINDETEAAVLEMGVTYPGDLKENCKYFKPQMGVITNIGVYHLQGCRTVENYIKAKAEIIEGVNPSGTLIVNGDDETIQNLDLQKFKGKLIFFGTGEKNHYRAINISYVKDGMDFTLIYENNMYHFFVPGYGNHNVYNAMAAVAAAHEAGIAIKEAGKRLEDFRHLPEHLQFKEGANGVTIIDDTWNCAPPSVIAALEVLKSTATFKRTVAVIGEMPQLLDLSDNEYKKIGQKAASLKIDTLVTVGDKAKIIGKCAVEKGMNQSRVIACHNAEQLYKTLVPYLNETSVILFKITNRTMKNKLIKQCIKKCCKRNK